MFFGLFRLGSNARPLLQPTSEQSSILVMSGSHGMLTVPCAAGGRVRELCPRLWASPIEVRAKRTKTMTLSLRFMARVSGGFGFLRGTSRAYITDENERQ